MSISINTPFGTIEVGPKVGWIFDFSASDIDIVTEAIIDGMNKKLPKIITGSAKPFFSILIGAGKNGEGHEENIYMFTIELDLVAIKTSSDFSTSPAFSTTVFVRRKTIEKLTMFFQDIKKTL